MFYSLPTEHKFDQGRFIRTEDLIDGIQEFLLIETHEPELIDDENLDKKYPFKIIVQVYLRTTVKTDLITLYFKTKENRDVGIGTMLRDLWGMTAPEPEEVAPTVTSKEEERSNAKDRRPVVRERVPLGHATN